MIDRDAADTVPITREDGSVFYAPAVQILNMRGEYSATLGCLPMWIRPYMKVSTSLVLAFGTCKRD
jgi:benzoate 4-monooxygenase